MSKQYKLLMVLLLPNSPCYQSQISIAESENIIPLNRSSCKNKKSSQDRLRQTYKKKQQFLASKLTSSIPWGVLKDIGKIINANLLLHRTWNTVLNPSTC
jgi:hypothetical protein